MKKSFLLGALLATTSHTALVQSFFPYFIGAYKK